MKDPRGTRAWRELRERVFEQQGRQCAECGTDQDLEVDHILPVDTHPDLAMDISNLQVLCKKHNNAKSNKVGTPTRRNWYDPTWLTSIK